jgi:hypothetical protein
MANIVIGTVHLFLDLATTARAILPSRFSNQSLLSSHSRRGATDTKSSGGLFSFIEEGCRINVLCLDFFDKAILMQEVWTTNTPATDFRKAAGGRRPERRNPPCRKN